MPKKQKKSEKSLSQAFEELEQIVQQFEEGDVDLEKSIEKFKKGLSISKFLKQRLKEIENEVVELKDDYDKEAEDAEIDADNATEDNQEEIPF